MLLIKKIPFVLLGFGLTTAFAAVYGGPAVRELSRRTGIQLTHQISTPNSSLGGLPFGKNTTLTREAGGKRESP